ncbi:MAG: RnfABCDGE type electron transport complex subunit G [Fusobacteriaceae bacterium]
MEKNRYIHYGMILATIAFLSAFILAMVNNFTSVVIKENATKVVNEARKKVLPTAKNFFENETIEKQNLNFIPGKNDSGETVGYVVTASENGYAGAIEFVLGISKDGKITGLDIVGHQETPGLGSKITNKDWKELWIGKDSTHKFDKNTDGFSGATISPEAVYRGMMKVLSTYDKEVK